MLLAYISQVLVGLGLIRFVAFALEALVFARWNLKEEGKTVALYYWMVFHTMAALQLVLVIFRFIGGKALNDIFSYIVFAGLAYVLMFYVPPYRSKAGLSLQMFEQMRTKQPYIGTQRLVILMNWRLMTATAGLVALCVLLIFRAFFWIGDFFDPLLQWLYFSVNWLYWGIAGISSVLCCISIFFGTQLLIANSRQRSSRKAMEREVGHKLTDEEYMRRTMAEHKNARMKESRRSAKIPEK